ncbi:unnamed protein product [Acanthoscelides obtectus]|uniref:Translation initiation factor eIF2B subunit alpha n=1 Tax=Acanthoscelides obtectus TaxID=200917 RepID=A0A9P0M4F8_ACAOB|nr:unnamed protein product [Acanthoscelides obtectus]CAK1664083.1 Translation initiation factor eIF-2B subunit alpha [Acanthoscelides obtectus]
MDGAKVREFFCKIIREDEDVSVGVAAIRTLMEIIKHSKSETVQELETNLKDGINVMKNTDYPVTAINSGCELFLRFITLAALDTRCFSDCKKIMLDRGHLFIKKLDEARGKIVKLASKFIEDGSKVLTHSRSRVVLQALRKAHKQNKRFEVFVTISAPDNSGKQMCKELQAEGIPCTLILDSAVGYIMEQVHFIMVGAEGVVESGGIVNKVIKKKRTRNALVTFCFSAFSFFSGGKLYYGSMCQRNEKAFLCAYRKFQVFKIISFRTTRSA